LQVEGVGQALIVGIEAGELDGRLHRGTEGRGDVVDVVMNVGAELRYQIRSQRRSGFRPVLDLQARDAPKLAGVVGDERDAHAHCVGRDQGV
jgi:hypothetical protein